jgi:LuxR family maltose regulon positive regulatory protein
VPVSATLPLHAAPAPPRAGEIPRDRLTRRLLGAREPVVVLRAPAGYGKTMLVAAWAREDPRAFAWLPPGGVVTDAREHVFVIDD